MEVDAIAHQTQFPGIMQALPTMKWDPHFDTSKFTKERACEVFGSQIHTSAYAVKGLTVSETELGDQHGYPYSAFLGSTLKKSAVLWSCMKSTELGGPYCQSLNSSKNYTRIYVLLLLLNTPIPGAISV